jgi:NADH-quinone oxidoreductase subunit N
VNPGTVSALLSVFPAIVPECILGAAACVLFLGATMRGSRHIWGGVAVIALAAAMMALGFSPSSVPSGASASSFVFIAPLHFDSLAMLTRWIALVGGLVLVLMSWDGVPDRFTAEYHGCLLLVVAGLSLTGAANDLVTLFLALELISIPTYVLLYLPRYDHAAQEAAMKYFLLSVFSSALLLFGFSYLYGLAGTTNLAGVLDALQRASNLPAVTLIALIMVTAGLCFRITAVPFHFYAPDVYQGTPTIAAAFLAFVPKVAGFVALARLLGYVVPAGIDVDAGRVGMALGPQTPMLLWILAAVTMTFGNIFGLLQDNLKRLFAYSSVAHAGYMLIGFAVAPYLVGTHAPGGIDAVIFYLAAYGAMTIGAFAILSYLSTPDRPVEYVDDLAGVSRSHPGIALLMALFLFSLIGIPLTAGFTGKLLLLMGAMSAPTTTSWTDPPALCRILALVGALNAAIGAWYYLRILAVMYLRNPIKPLPARRNWAGLAALWCCAAVTLVLGVYPDAFLRPAQKAATPLADRQSNIVERWHNSRPAN